MLYRRPLLAIHLKYSSVYVCIPNSRTIPSHHPSPWPTISSFSQSVRKSANGLNLTLFKEKAMATHSSTLAWKIPWMEEPGGLQSMGLLRATSLSLFTFMHWRRKWHPTPAFLPGKPYGQRSLWGYSPWGRKELDTTKQVSSCISLRWPSR